MVNSKLNKIICHVFIILLLLIVSVFWADASYAAYSPDAAADYALKWTDNNKTLRNSKYYSKGYDCTNFVSQCVVAGGKGFKKPKKLDLTAKGWIRGVMFTDTSSRWYNAKYSYKKGVLKRNVFCVSTSFNQVDKFYATWKNYDLGKVYSKSGGKVAIAKNSQLQKDLRRGDIIQVWDEPSNKGSGWHHSMIVTGGSKGNWKVTYHSNDVRDKFLSTRNFSTNAKYRIIRIN